MSKEDPNQISIAMRNFTANKVPDKIGLMVKAQQLYDYLTISEREFPSNTLSYVHWSQSKQIFCDIF